MTGKGEKETTLITTKAVPSSIENVCVAARQAGNPKDKHYWKR